MGLRRGHSRRPRLGPLAVSARAQVPFVDARGSVAALVPGAASVRESGDKQLAGESAFPTFGVRRGKLRAPHPP